jgi:hypothetical protein
MNDSDFEKRNRQNVASVRAETIWSNATEVEPAPPPLPLPPTPSKQESGRDTRFFAEFLVLLSVIERNPKAAARDIYKLAGLKLSTARRRVQDLISQEYIEARTGDVPSAEGGRRPIHHAITAKGKEFMQYVAQHH